MRKIINRCEQWLRDEVSKAGASGIVLGLSGGIDSSVLAVLGVEALGRDNVLGIIMPCHSIKNDESDARLLIEKFNIKYKFIDLTGIFDAMCEIAGEISDSAKVNLKARLRMSTLYTQAQTKNFLVCGTSNRSEFETGYFTKYGDSGVDLMPLANFLKKDIREIAKILEIPKEIINKAPSAGLYEGQTDEDDMGFSYEILDKYLDSGEISDNLIKEKIEVLRRRSEHKRKPIPIFRF